MSSHDSSAQSAQSSVQDTGARSIKEKASERIGQWIKGKYRIDQLLGVGGMAAVYAASHRNGQKFAVKVLHVEFARDDGVKTRFLKEGYVANKVSHPGVIQVVDDDETELGETYLVMELLEGDTLQGVWKKHNRKMPPVLALQICADMLDVLGLFHEVKIIHRDIKPANIFITSDGRTKLLDFGVAQDRGEGAEAMTKAGTALGTPSYMSPEQAMGKSDSLDGRSDVFSIGATLYAILSGKRLHHGKSDNEAFILAATQPPPSIARSAPELPVDVIALVDKSLQWDRRNRFQSAHEMRDECYRVIQLLGGQVHGAGAAAAPPPAPVAAAPVPAAVSRPPAPPPPPPAPEPLRVRSPRAPVSAHAGTSGAPEPSEVRGRPAPSLVPPAEARASQPPAEEGLRQARGAKVALGAAGAAGKKVADERGPHAAIKEVFERFELSLPSLRQYGLDHPEAKGRVRAIHRTVGEALRSNPDGIQFFVRPFCFTSLLPGSVDQEAPVWEPPTPDDAIPYNLCAAGVEEMTIGAGVAEEEVQQLVKVLMTDPYQDAANADVKGALWEAGFTHISYRVYDDIAADAADEEKLLSEVANLEQMAREDLREVAAMAVSTEESGLDDRAAAAALSLEQAQKAALAARLSLDMDGWRRRFYDLAAEAYADGEARRDARLLLDPLSGYGEQLLGRNNLRELFDVYFKVMERVQQLGQVPLAERGKAPLLPRELGVTELTRGLFPPEVMRQLLRAMTGEKLSADDRQWLCNSLNTVLSSLDADWFEEALANANQLPEGEALELVMAYIERHVPGKESFLIARLDTFRPALAQRFLGLVTATRDPTALALLKPLMNSQNLVLRCEAAALLTQSDEELGKLLVQWLEAKDGKLRMAALTTMKHHHVRTAGPGLVKQIDALETFQTRSAEEQRQVFDTLYALNPARAEAVLIKVVEKHGLMNDAALDRTRAIACDVLGKCADSDTPISALEGAARTRPWNGPELRRSASRAAEAIISRLGKAVGGAKRK